MNVLSNTARAAFVAPNECPVRHHCFSRESDTQPQFTDTTDGEVIAIVSIVTKRQLRQERSLWLSGR